MTIRLYIFDDDAMSISHIEALLRELQYPSSSIWPPEQATVKRWKQVWDTLLQEIRDGRIREDDCCMLFLDLALGEKGSDIEEGIREILAKRDNPKFDKFVWMIFSDNANRPELRKKVDAVIYKSMLSGDAAAAMLNIRISDALEAWKKRTQRIPPPSPHHSNVDVDISTAAGCRLVADLGRARIEALKPDDWPAMRVEALTGGYSGAYVVRFHEIGGSRKLVAKLSLDERMLADEAKQWEKAVESTAFTSILNNSCPLKTIDGLSCMVMASVQGSTLEERAKDGSPSPGALLGTLFQLGTNAANTCGRVQPCALMDLEPRNIQAFNAAWPDLLKLREGCARRNLLPPDFPSRETIDRFAGNVVGEWNVRLRERGLDRPITVPQHGDLNPRNILVLPSGALQLIDVSRFGAWPAGYDLVRLELQLLLRLLGTEDGNEFFPDQMKSWTELWKSVEEGVPSPSGSDAPASLVDILCAIATARSDLYAALPKDGPSPAETTAVMRCFDALKMACYQDAADFKRLLFLYIAIRSAQSAQLL